ncbi:hypothetical protein [Tropicimonas sp. IMCC6043]|uniref:hypothetical protein n=1 Tax=Tropicimonas sp. IMCC6043 TaxID=2510645 RepID=UPI00101C1FDD|nr:hypothetical protein [Tropicimonas sp. IMCC6043]RYH06902.1 hypothetical protein EU800_22260 [Tropicimonas sp. IMCC6043]
MVSLSKLDTGVKVSGAAHLGLILWMAIGGLFSFDRSAPLSVSNVTVISSEQFAAMMATGSQAPDVAEAPATPAQPEAPETEDTTAPAPEESPETAAAPEPAEPDIPEPEPQPAEAVETPQAEVTPVAPPAPEQPALPDGASTVLAPDNPPAPDAAPRVAPLPADRPDPEANVDEEVQLAARPEPEPEATPAPEAPEENTAPPETGTVIETEASEEAGGTAVAALAPPGSPRPARRPDRPTPAPAPEPEPEAAETETAEPDAPADPLADAIAAAVAEAATDAPAAATPGPARQGPPLTSGEKDALRIAVQQCWNVGSLSSDALRTTVTVFVRMNENGTPDGGSIRMLDFEGGPEAAALQAYEAARRAILRCGASGFDLPPEKYDQWREVEMVFNPENMRIR